MNVSVYLSISALIYTTITAIAFFCKKKINTIENKLFGWLILSTIAGIISIIIILTSVFDVETTIYIVKMWGVFIYFGVVVFTMYAFVISHKEPNIKYREKYKILFWLYMIFNLISIALILLLPIYHYDNIPNMMYYAGPSGWYVLVASAIHILAMIFFLLKNIKRIKEKCFYPIILYVILTIIMFACNIYLIGIIVANAVCGLFVNIMYHTMENPDLKMLNAMELAKDSAEKANNAKSDFLSSMSHEIRTPLNAIVGFSELNENATTLDEIKENSKDVIKASKVLLEIVNGVLDISKIESGKVEVTNAPYKPYEMLNNIIKMINYRFEEKKLIFNVNIAPDIPTMLYGDRSNIQKIITNLLTNAAKYTDKGHVDFNVSCTNKGNVCQLFISVEDTGRGIQPENIDKLFTKFNRLEEDKNTTNEGTGLGLVITKHLVELMGGNITVQSKFGSGSKFSVTLNQTLQAVDSDSSSINIMVNELPKTEEGPSTIGNIVSQ